MWESNYTTIATNINNQCCEDSDCEDNQPNNNTPTLQQPVSKCCDNTNCEESVKLTSTLSNSKTNKCCNDSDCEDTNKTTTLPSIVDGCCDRDCSVTTSTSTSTKITTTDACCDDNKAAKQDTCCDKNGTCSKPMMTSSAVLAPQISPKSDKEQITPKKPKKSEKIKLLDDADEEADGCNDGCCAPKKEQPAPKIVQKSEKVKPLNEDDGCNDGCCQPKGTNVESGSDVLIKTKLGETEIEICCDICWNGSCCNVDCCEVACCVLEIKMKHKNGKTKKILWWHVPVPSFFTKNSYFNFEDIPPPVKPENISTLNLEISIHCADCCPTIIDHLLKMPGVLSAKVVFITKKGEVTYNHTVIDESEIVRQIELIGFPSKIIAPTNTSKSSLNLNFKNNIGQQDVSVLESLKEYDGVESVDVNILDQKILITYDHHQIGARRVVDLVTKLGYLVDVDISVAVTPGAADTLRLRSKVIISILLTIPVIFIAFIFPQFSATNKAFEETFIVRQLSVSTFFLVLLSTPIQFWVAKSLYISAYRAMRYAKKANMDTLVIMSTSTAYFYSAIVLLVSIITNKNEGEIFFETSAILLTLIMIGRYLEAVAKTKTSNLLTQLLNLQVPDAVLVQNSHTKHENSMIGEKEVIDITNYDEEEIINVHLLHLGDILKVSPGSAVPTDGDIIFGETYIDESIVTGESIPVHKKVGDSVVGSTTNQNGLFYMRVTKTVGENMLHHIGKLVSDAQAAKPQVQQLADNIAAYFVPSILVLSTLVFIIWYIILKNGVVVVNSTPLSFALQFGFSVLVISCPCAFGLAVPTAVMVGTSVGVKHGIIFKGGDVLEKCQKITSVIFDKTGTLTNGKPVVVNHEIFNGMAEKEFFGLVGSAEIGSEHVIGKSIAKFAVDRFGCELQQPTDFVSMPGCGVSCSVNNHEIQVGKLSWLVENLPKSHLQQYNIDKIVALENSGNTVVCVGIDGVLAGVVALCDTPREEASSVVRKLQQKGIEVFIVSGDNQQTAERVGFEVGIQNSHVNGGVLPAGKSDFVKKLQKQGKRVMMVGDGINDSPALACADVGVAMGGGGTDIAKSAADVVLVKSNLNDVFVALDISKKCISRIKLNFIWAGLYNIITIPIGAGVLYTFGGISIPPALSGLSEILSSVPVIIFSLLLQRYVAPK